MKVSRDTSTAKWSKRVGLAAFLFFLIKGLLWLIVPAAVAYFAIK
ncbi:MAG: alanyl-tRNA synthetase [Pyrinomonadaceae bacterium]